MRQFLLQSASGITKCVKVYYKVRQELQSVAFITKCVSTGGPEIAGNRHGIPMGIFNWFKLFEKENESSLEI